MSDDALARLRAICLALPEAEERETWGAATFRVRDKIFALARGGGDAPSAVCCKAPPGVQEMLLAADSTRFFSPPYVGHKGWIGAHLSASTDWDELEDLVVESYRMTAPKRVAALLASDER